MLSQWVRLLLLVLSSSNCDVPVAVRGHSKECSKQFPREGDLCSTIVGTKYYLPLSLMLEAELL